MFGAVEASGDAGAGVAGVAFFSGGVDESFYVSGSVNMTKGVAFAAGDVDGAIEPVDCGAGANEGGLGGGRVVGGDSFFSVTTAGGDLESR